MYQRETVVGVNCMQSYLNQLMSEIGKLSIYFPVNTVIKIKTLLGWHRSIITTPSTGLFIFRRKYVKRFIKI